ncbi:MAG: hypothetical protein LBF40_10045 [Deltaproteobacteria bacterium]|nr:hypothetical protein [Deltaproteobacteria bacterium]
MSKDDTPPAGDLPKPAKKRQVVEIVPDRIRWGRTVQVGSEPGERKPRPERDKRRADGLAAPKRAPRPQSEEKAPSDAPGKAAPGVPARGGGRKAAAPQDALPVTKLRQKNQTQAGEGQAQALPAADKAQPKSSPGKEPAWRTAAEVAPRKAGASAKSGKSLSPKKVPKQEPPFRRKKRPADGKNKLNDKDLKDAPNVLPKRARKILTLNNPELLKKAAEYREKHHLDDSEAANASATATGGIAATGDHLPGPMQVIGSVQRRKGRLSKRNRRILRKYGLGSGVLSTNQSNKKLLNYRMLFTEPPIEDMPDEGIAENIRLLLLAYADHKFPKEYVKFVSFLKNNMCFGITDAQLDRLLVIMKDRKHVTLGKDGTVAVNVGITPAMLPEKPKTKA